MVNRIYVESAIADQKLKSRVLVYTIEKRFSKDQLQRIGAMLTNPVSQDFFINVFAHPGKLPAIEIGFLPGVTDNVGNTVREMIEDGLGVRFAVGEGVYSSHISYVETLINPLIQRIAINEELPVPRVHLTNGQLADTVSLDVSEDELLAIGKLGIKNADQTRRGPLALDQGSMKAIQTHFQSLHRSPTDVELESLAQTWSEHCKHTIMNSPIDDISEGLFAHYIKRATDKILRTKKNFCVSVFSDNSGAITFDRTNVLTHKVETHNSPSALDPFGGSVTGIVGVNRDCIGFGLGAKPIANTYGFCVGNLLDTRVAYRDALCTQPLHSPKRILEGIVAGVNNGGNCSGIPTPLGFVYTNKRYKGKPLVFVGTVGLIPRRIRGKRSWVKKARMGDYIVIAGGRVGLDGIHGATFSSEALSAGSPATAVQIGDPITQKKLSDVLVNEARGLGLFTSITDNGAGGLSCSVAEMAKECGGCVVHLEKVPLKYPGLSPWQIWISESQERMTLSVPKKKWRKLQALCLRRGVEVTRIGVFTKSSRCVVRNNKKIVMDLSMNFLHHGMPKIHLYTKAIRSDSIPFGTKRLLSLLSSHSHADFSWISNQFDHEVQGTSVTKPLQGKGRVNADAIVIRPVLSSHKGIVLTHALYPEYGDIDPYQMAVYAIETAVARAVVAGADPERIALIDNFCWCSARDPKRLWQLKEAARGCYDAAIKYGTPFISGKDSMFNDFYGFDEIGNSVKISIPPTLLISAIGIVGDTRKSVTLDFKFPGDLIYMIEGTRKACDALARAERFELVASGVAVAPGKVEVAIAKSGIAGMLGARVYREEGRFMVSVDPKKKQSFERVMRRVQCEPLGEVTQTPKIVIRDSVNGNFVENVSLDACVNAYRSAFLGY